MLAGIRDKERKSADARRPAEPVVRDSISDDGGRRAEDQAGRGRSCVGVDERHDDSRGVRYPMYILLLVSGSLIVIIMFGDKLRELVDFATTVSFLIAPIIAIFNFRLVTGRYMAQELQPPSWLKALAYAGIAFLCGFAAFYALVRFGIVAI